MEAWLWTEGREIFRVTLKARGWKETDTRQWHCELIRDESELILHEEEAEKTFQFSLPSFGFIDMLSLSVSRNEHGFRIMESTLTPVDHDGILDYQYRVTYGMYRL